MRCESVKERVLHVSWHGAHQCADDFPVSRNEHSVKTVLSSPLSPGTFNSTDVKGGRSASGPSASYSPAAAERGSAAANRIHAISLTARFVEDHSVILNYTQ